MKRAVKVFIFIFKLLMINNHLYSFSGILEIIFVILYYNYIEF